MAIANKFQSKIDGYRTSISGFWLNHYSKVFVLTLLIATFIGGYVWYQAMYQSGWSGQQKDEFLARQHQDVNFQEQRFKDTIAEIEKRKIEFDSPLVEVRGIFLSDN